MSASSPSTTRRFAWAFVAYLVLVILWGAWVRVTFSGDGCGDHWPLCRGTLVPTGDAHTAIELFHRVTSALCGPLALGLVVIAFRAFPKGHPARRYAVAALVFVITEGLFGALLVKLRRVAYDTSIERAYLMALHLCNTFALLYAAVGTAERAVDSADRGNLALRVRLEHAFGFFLLLLVGTTGAVTALGDTLFPSQDLRSAIVADFDAGSHPFLQLRVFHPIFAIATGLYLIHIASRRFAASDPRLVSAARWLGVSVVVQVGLGFANMALSAPALMQIAHLAGADVAFIAFTSLAFRDHGSSSTASDATPLASSSA